MGLLHRDEDASLMLEIYLQFIFLSKEFCRRFHVVVFESKMLLENKDPYLQIAFHTQTLV